MLKLDQLVMGKNVSSNGNCKCQAAYSVCLDRCFIPAAIQIV